MIAHYQNGALLSRILDALECSGVDIDDIPLHSHAPNEKFHIGGCKATQHLIDKRPLDPQAHVFDVGCGIVGTARHIATLGHRVTGIDLNPEYIESFKY